MSTILLNLFFRFEFVTVTRKMMGSTRADDDDDDVHLDCKVAHWESSAHMVPFLSKSRGYKLPGNLPSLSTEECHDSSPDAASGIVRTGFGMALDDNLRTGMIHVSYASSTETRPAPSASLPLFWSVCAIHTFHRNLPPSSMILSQSASAGAHEASDGHHLFHFNMSPPFWSPTEANFSRHVTPGRCIEKHRSQKALVQPFSRQFPVHTVRAVVRRCSSIPRAHAKRDRLTFNPVRPV
ncbi:uncharacterized protein B0I36DRAFT_316768 [Microdochium trichocladiopsis]|uniref:Uncharacterized protein n=1 Tax=Microdochium trichocladiopsis TaxID=1682393 RepID=A0A9P9BW41_9PEZI|nr:uncharacterized protein B0I36DRAFT_316768 [Microdochium trichocladiopsis]KAH7034696.1 hypothetical protein B0I36DRAFT_316768 [Microdochium trichocladiopsis]